MCWGRVWGVECKFGFVVVMVRERNGRGEGGSVRRGQGGQGMYRLSSRFQEGLMNGDRENVRLSLIIDVM